MPPKKKIQAPIDRPLSKAYLRQFSGWSSNYPPGLSEPNSLRVMENVIITRDGAARIRPGLRSFMRERSPYPLVGSHELFFTDEGEKAYLVAVREGAIVTFRVVTYVPDPSTGVPVPTMQTLSEAGFDFPAGDVSFSGDTTYVRYLQIDNKIFALSNTSEPMVMFWVGLGKKAEVLSSIDRPAWITQDKLTVVHPDKAWIDNASAPTADRRNLLLNPDFEQSTVGWRFPAVTSEFEGLRGSMRRVSTDPHLGSWSLMLTSDPLRTNLCPHSLSDIDSYGIGGWYRGDGCLSVAPAAGSMDIAIDPSESSGSAMSAKFPLPSETRLHIAFDIVDAADVGGWFIQAWFFDVNNDPVGYRQEIGSGDDSTPQRVVSSTVVVPSQAATMRVLIGANPTSLTATGHLYIANVFVGEGDDTTALDGDDGTDYYWTGTPGASVAVYHPPQSVKVRSEGSGYLGAGTYTGAVYCRSSGSVDVSVATRAERRDGVDANAIDQITVGTSWTRVGGSVVVTPATTIEVGLEVTAASLGRGDYLQIDSALVEKVATLGTFFTGYEPQTTTTQVQRWEGEPHASQSTAKKYASALANPTAETPAANTLISSTTADNVYNFGFFYTISNELGESAASQVTTVRTKRLWTGWEWKTSNTDGSPSSTATTDPLKCADQLVAYMPQDVFEAAIANGATHWSAYFYTWGPNDVPPVTAIKFAEIPLDQNSIYGVDSFAVLTPQQAKLGVGDPVIPTEGTLFNATDPTKGSQGLVASDRIILVADPADPARITWSSGSPGDYHNFSPLLGGGTKQQTTGNLHLSACVKLWQNPQSVDTLTILNLTTDGRSNSVYMQPAQITSLSETINIMGFEEATGMDGTSSPYGCEVVNNGLYHPLEDSIIKSTANNYNLSHRSVTDDIANSWQALQRHDHIVSCTLNNRIFYLVHNVYGATLEDGCWGNEIWVLDVGAETPTWSRWLVQGISLRTMEVGGKVTLSVVHPDGIFLFDVGQYNDEHFALDGEIVVSAIPWYLETNTQGANRAHDAWANLQQMNVVLGNFQGQLRYGLRGKDVNGMDVEMEKKVYASVPPWDGLNIIDEIQDPDEEVEGGTGVGDRLAAAIAPFDREDFFLVRKVMKEWVFFAGSVENTYSAGQVNLVQYRYTPVTVNVGYEYGSVETFEYGSSDSEDATTDSGTPKPYIDMGRP